MKIYTFDIEPIGKPRMVRSDVWKKRNRVMQYWAFKDDINIIAREKKYKVAPRLNISFILTMPESWSEKKKKLQDGKPHTQIPDIDNLEKAFFDCLCDNDSYVWAVNKTKRWGRKGQIVVKQ